MPRVVQPEPVPHVAIDDDGAAFDHADREPVPLFTIVDIEHQRLANERGLTADRDPLVRRVPLHDDVGIDANRAVRWLGESVAFVTSSSQHAQGRATAMPPVRDDQIVGLLRVLAG